MTCFEVHPLESKAAMDMVLSYHYSRRKVGAAFCFGLHEGSTLVGCCVFSKPASYTLCKGVCGDEYKDQVLELSRLVIITTARNAASFLISKSLKQLGDKIVVSYADCNNHVGHIGYVYQATNWLYTGKGNAEPKWLHPNTGQVVSFTRRHIDRKAEALGIHWKQLRQEPQSGKHRYVVFTGNRRFKHQARHALRYQVLPYPKGDTSRHEASGRPLQETCLF